MSDTLFDSLPDESGKNSGKVNCLGIAFDNDEARRAYFTEELRKRLNDPEFRKIEGFPIGEDEDILNLSDPPYYTVCPNPWIGEFLDKHGNHSNDMVPSEPYSGDLAVTNRHPVYSFHPYHTKVPPDIIKELINYYTTEGDLVMDVFCGAGMTGVAARESGRNVILNDLSPIATFISSINTNNYDIYQVKTTVNRIIRESENKLGWVYKTEYMNKQMDVNYYVWTDVFNCPECLCEFPFFPHAVIHYGNKVKTKKEFLCPSCGAELNVRKVERILTTEGKKKSMVWVNAGSGRNRICRTPDEYDFDVLRKVKSVLAESNQWIPSDKIDPDGYSAKLAQLGDKGIKDVSRFLSERNRLVYADLWQRMREIQNVGIRSAAMSCLTSIFTVISERQGYFGGGGGMSGNLYMPIVRMEKNVYDSLRRKIKKFIDAEASKPKNHQGHLVTTQSATKLDQIGDQSIDYIYTDPPFGANIIYSEMNLILESWLKVKSNNTTEAVIDDTKRKDFDEYGLLMTQAFKECYRILKPGKWLTVEFHNTQASVWNLIQSAISKAGFVVAQVSRLDKGSTTILADIRPGAVVQDLIISAFKPTSEFVDSFNSAAEEECGVWEFVRNCLSHLPIVRKTGSSIAYLSERNPRVLYDQMLAYYVMSGYMVPISNNEFQIGIRQRFIERDGMIFLPRQVTKYDKARFTENQITQGSLFVCDEASAIEWLRLILLKKPQTFQQLHPQFLKEISGWSKNEESLELSTLLEQNFLCFHGDSEVPSQIHTYLSTNWPELRNRPSNDSGLIEKARDRWYVPNPSKASDIERLRERALLKEFAQYVKAKKKLTVFRLEAVRAGFQLAWHKQDYKTIIEVAEKIPSNILEEDPKLLMWYDQAITRTM